MAEWTPHRPTGVVARCDENITGGCTKSHFGGFRTPKKWISYTFLYKNLAGSRFISYFCNQNNQDKKRLSWSAINFNHYEWYLISIVASLCARHRDCRAMGHSPRPVPQNAPDVAIYSYRPTGLIRLVGPAVSWYNAHWLLKRISPSAFIGLEEKCFERQKWRIAPKQRDSARQLMADSPPIVGSYPAVNWQLSGSKLKIDIKEPSSFI